MFSSQDSPEMNERKLPQTCLGRIGSALIYMNGNPGMGLVSGTRMASSGSSLFLLFISVPVCALIWTSSCVWAGGVGEREGMATSSSRLSYILIKLSKLREKRESFPSSISIHKSPRKILIGSDEVICSLRANQCGHICNELSLTMSGDMWTPNARKGWGGRGFSD